jgi:hypothetical protein
MLVVYAARSMVTPVVRGLAAIPAVRRLIELALDEDLGRGDVTSQVTLGKDGPAVTADMNARDPIVAFGLDVAAAVFHLVDPRIDEVLGATTPAAILDALDIPAAALDYHSA